MEEQKMKHICKFCKKRFPCGRSLGGHIRSHLPKPGYELRENPKKTWRSVAAADHEDHTMNSSFSSSSNETGNQKSSKISSQNQGKRSNFGRNNSQSSVSEVVEAEQEEQEEVVVAMCLIMLSRDVGSWGDVSSSFAAATTAADQGSNSKSRRRRREKVQGNVSVSAAAADKKSDSAVSGYQQKGLKLKEIEVNINGFESNDQNSKFSESKKKREKIDHVGKSIKMESLASGYVKDSVKMKDFDVLENGFLSNDQNKHSSDRKRKIDAQSAASGFVKKSSKDVEFEVSEHGISSYNQKSSDHDIFDSEYYSSMSKRSKFECTTCNKVFQSYQALGGHRASHKKHGGGGKCSPPFPKLEAETNIGGNDVVSSPDPRQPQPQQQHELVPDVGAIIGSSPSKKVVHKHECPICYRVFPSGQALGGHKRSHLLVTSNGDINGKITEAKINNHIHQTSRIADVVERLSSIESTRDLLDLNFPPAPAQDETTMTTTTTTTTTFTTTTSSSTSLVGFIKPYWCVESSQKHESLLGLISN